MKILAILPTHNRLHPKVLRGCLESLQAAKLNAPGSQVVVCGWAPVPDYGFGFLESKFRLEGYGHLNILMQLGQVVYDPAYSADVYAVCDHHVLYPDNYFEQVLSALRREPARGGVVYRDYVGLTAGGYQPLTQPDLPLYAYSFRREYLEKHLWAKIQECMAKGYCSLEPGAEGLASVTNPKFPLVHVNHGGGMTSHSRIFGAANQTVHPYWASYTQWHP